MAWSAAVGWPGGCRCYEAAVRGRVGWRLSARSSSGWQPQPFGDAGGFTDRGRGGLVLTRPDRVGGVVEQSLAWCG
jgi:hypothetical protein